MAISDTTWHLVIRVSANGRGMSRRLDYDLSEVLRHTQEGADPLDEWAERRPDEVALWLTWNPLRGMHYMGVTPNVDVLGFPLVSENHLPPALTRAVLAGVALALRIDSGEFGEGVDSATPSTYTYPMKRRSAAPPPSELVDPRTLEITDGE